MSEFKNHPTYSRMYWRRSETTKTSCAEADATHVEIEVRRGCYRNSFEFEWPKERVKADELEVMLENAYASGKKAAQADFRAAIGL